MKPLLEKIAEKVERILGIVINVYGFDTSVGLPKPTDYRDMPNLYSQGEYPKIEEELQNRLNKAKLIFGLVNDTIPEFIKSKSSPISFISFDLDFYSSTRGAFKVLETEQNFLLPRIHCYFDDIMGATCSDFVGERLAISEFNDSHHMRKISPIYGLRYFLPQPQANRIWAEMFFLAHIFDHDLYGCNDGLVKLRHRDLNTKL